jgi:hypothetical protein
MNENFPFDHFLNTDEALVHIDKSMSHREFMLCRASAIEQYAHLEHILFSLYVFLENKNFEEVGEKYHSLDAQSRLVHIGKQLKLRFGEKYNIFWESLFEHLKQLPTRRNLIVHWTIVKTSTSDGVSWSSLKPISKWDKYFFGRELFLKDILQFTMATNFFYHLIQNFIWVISKSSKKIHSKWKETFQFAIVLPVPETHPLFNYLQPAVDAKMGLL